MSKKSLEEVVNERLKTELRKINKRFSYPLLLLKENPTATQKIEALFLLMRLNLKKEGGKHG